jgi:uncharacterized surface protein with fasciclin (FAS1) repeats
MQIGALQRNTSAVTQVLHHRLGKKSLIKATTVRTRYIFSAAHRTLKGRNMTTATTSSPITTPSSLANIVDTAQKAGHFKTLINAIQAAGMADTLRGNGPFTVFAPNDDAFAKMPKDALEALLKDKTGLTKLLGFHVLPGKFLAADIKPGKFKTVQGSEANIATEGGVSIEGAKVVAADVLASNGVIHTVDTVLVVK